MSNISATRALKAGVKGKADAMVLRVDLDPKHGSFGVWLFDGRVFCVTLEPRTRAGTPMPEPHAAIAEGIYDCVRVTSALVTKITKGKFTETFEITNVLGKTLVRIHPGNSDDDTEACVLTGESFGKFTNGDRVVLNSGKTFVAWMNRLYGVDHFTLEVKNAEITQGAKS